MNKKCKKDNCKCYDQVQMDRVLKHWFKHYSADIHDINDKIPYMSLCKTKTKKKLTNEMLLELKYLNDNNL